MEGGSQPLIADLTSIDYPTYGVELASLLPVGLLDLLLIGRLADPQQVVIVGANDHAQSSR